MAREVGLPVREFLYTLDQIAYLLELTVPVLRASYIHFQGRSTGVPDKDLMVAINIAPEGEKPEWRVPERYLKRWMRFKGFKIHERAYLK